MKYSIQQPQSVGEHDHKDDENMDSMQKPADSRRNTIIVVCLVTAAIVSLLLYNMFFGKPIPSHFPDVHNPAASSTLDDEGTTGDFSDETEIVEPIEETSAPQTDDADDATADDKPQAEEAGAEPHDADAPPTDEEAEPNAQAQAHEAPTAQ